MKIRAPMKHLHLLLTADEISVILNSLNSESLQERTVFQIVLRNLPAKAIRFLADNINAMLTLGHFPDSWKMTKLYPFLDPENLPMRPLTPVL